MAMSILLVNKSDILTTKEIYVDDKPAEIL
jgi:hypothetical protein